MTTDQAIKWCRSSLELIEKSHTYCEAYHFYGYSYGTINAFALVGIIDHATEAVLKCEAQKMFDNVKSKVGYN